MDDERRPLDYATPPPPRRRFNLESAIFYSVAALFGLPLTWLLLTEIGFGC